MEGFETGDRYDTRACGATTCGRSTSRTCESRLRTCSVSPVGFHNAMHILNIGRLSLGTGSVGAAKWLLDEAIDHVNTRRQFGRPLADFELVQEKIGWMVRICSASSRWRISPPVWCDAGVPDYSIESAICKVAGTEFLWYQANRALQSQGRRRVHARPALREGPARHPDLSHLEGANVRVCARSSRSRNEAPERPACRPGEDQLHVPIHSLGVLAELRGRANPA